MRKILRTLYKSNPENDHGSWVRVVKHKNPVEIGFQKKEKMDLEEELIKKRRKMLKKEKQQQQQQEEDNAASS